MARKGKAARKSKTENLDGQGGPVKYTLVSGETIKIYPVSGRLVQAIEERYTIPEPPTERIETIDGDFEEIPKPNDPDYLALVAELAEERAEAILRLIASRALADIQVSLEDDWVGELQWIEPSWTPPDDLRELKNDYLQYWLIPSRQDWEVIMYLAIATTMLAKEDVERTLHTFRSALQGQIRETLGDTFLTDLLQPESGDEPGGAMVEPDAQ